MKIKESNCVYKFSLGFDCICFYKKKKEEFD